MVLISFISALRHEHNELGSRDITIWINLQLTGLIMVFFVILIRIPAYSTDNVFTYSHVHLNVIGNIQRSVQNIVSSMTPVAMSKHLF